MKKIFVDVETTGLNQYKHQITELACLYEDISEFHMYCLPEKKPETYHELEEKGMPSWSLLQEKGVSEKELYEKFKKWLEKIIDPFNKQDKAVFFGYNAKFDRDFCYQLFKRNNDNFFNSYFHRHAVDVMSTVLEAVAFDKITVSESFKLEKICEHIGISLENAHSALHDIKATRDLYYKLRSI